MILLYWQKPKKSWKKNYIIFKGNRETQSLFQIVKIVKKWKTPTKIKKVKSFLGFANFYKYFIKNFSYMTKPLNKFKEKK